VDPERVSERVANFCSWVGGEDGREELGSGRPDDQRLSDFDVDVGNTEVFENVKAPKGRFIGVFAVERVGFGSDPKRVGGGGSNLTDANDIEAGPLDLHLVQASLDSGSDLELPDAVELVVDDDPER
jgi:hypothetical protein